MATIYDVAHTAGVSPKTVSRVLNGDAPVGEKTRHAVEQAIAELGYVRSNAARMMRATKSGLVGVITGAISCSLDPSKPTGLPELFIVQGIQAALSDAGKTLMIADTGGDEAKAPSLIRSFLEHRVEGLIYVADHHKLIPRLDVDGRVPLVLANCFDEAGTPALVPDDRKGQRDLVEALISAGHRRIAYLTLPESMVATRLRVEGYREALEAAALPHDPDLVREAYREGYQSDRGLLEREIDAVLALPDPPTVLCCGNDEMAMRVYGLLRSRGLDVPGDVSVAGFDDYRAISETLYPALTTSELAYRTLGLRAAERLLGLIDKRKDGPAVLSVPGSVAWRGSVNGTPTIPNQT